MDFAFYAMHGADARKHMSLVHQTSPVAPPIASGPPRALVEELGAGFERRLNLAFGVVLHPRLPLVGDQPPRHVIVVVGVEDVLAPFLILETVEEIVALENLGAVRASATRHARGSAIDVVGSRDLKVAPLNVGCAEPVVDAGHQVAVHTLHALAGSDASHPLVILKRRQDPGHERRRPLYVVVGHDRDCCLDVISVKGLADLEALVRLVDVQHFDLGLLGTHSKRLGHLLEGLVLVPSGHEDELGRLARQDAHERLLELLKAIMDGGDDDRDVVRCVSRLFLLGGERLVRPMADAVDKEPEIAMEPGQYVSSLTTRAYEQHQAAVSGGFGGFSVGYGSIPENRVQDDPERHGLENIESRDYNIH